MSDVWGAAYTVEELAFQLKDAKAQAIVTQKPLLDNAREAARVASIPDDRILLLGPERDDGARYKHFTSVRNVEGTARFRRTKARPDDLAVLPYSSGTTGMPKGVMLSSRSINTNVLQTVAAEAHQLTWNGLADGKGDRVLGFLPFFHVYGTVACSSLLALPLTSSGLVLLLIACIYRGWTLVVMPRFELEAFCRAIQSHRITFIYLVPPVILALAKHPVVDHFDLSSLRMLTSGAAPLTRELVEAVHNRIMVPVKQGYGLSETGPTATAQPWADWRTKIGSVGRLLPNMSAKHMSDDGRELPVGEVGELWLKGPNVFLGYLNNDASTRAALTPDGWFRTGDVGYQDAEANFYVTDRVKELVKYKGFQVAPAELEGLLASHARIDDCAVLGVYDEAQATEVPVAFIVAAKGVERNDAAAEEIKGWLAARVAGYKQLRGGVRFVDEIPKSASGKILRRVLKTRLEEEKRAAARKAGPKL